MILARITRAIRQQNWFAVALEFVIVIAGVVIGFQINAWNDRRIERAADRAYLERLHREVIDLIAIRQNLTDRRQRVNADLGSAMAVLQGPAEQGELNEAECLAISEAHIYSNPTDELPTLSELLSAGRLDSLSNGRIRDRLMRFFQVRASVRNVLENININVYELPTLYPELFDQAVLVAPSERANRPLAYACHTDLMRSNPEFLAHLFSDASRYDASVNGVILPLNSELDALREELERTVAGYAP